MYKKYGKTTYEGILKPTLEWKQARIPSKEEMMHTGEIAVHLGTDSGCQAEHTIFMLLGKK